MLGGKGTTTREYFELLTMPMSFLTLYTGTIEVCINDGTARLTSLCPGKKNTATGSWEVEETTVDLIFPKPQGSAQVSSYVPYLNQSTFIG